MISAKRAVVCGVSSDGLTTTVLPAARAGMVLASNSSSGKFQAVIRPQTPMGSFTTWPWVSSGSGRAGRFSTKG
ncbi:hypothetical protein D3C85_1739810 [compost metagenome]